MRRIAIALTVLALVGVYACSSDAPGPTTPKGPGTGQPPSGANGLSIRLFTSNANPPADSCTLLQAIVTRNGANVADGTGVSFSSTFGVFQQNDLNLISVVTQNGAAVTALCSGQSGTATVRAQATDGNDTVVATITIVFQPVAGAGPFVSHCDPSFGTPAGGTTLTINGGRFFGSPSSTRVLFSAAGVIREGLVTDLTANTVTVVTPAFPEAQSSSVPVEIRLTLGTNTSTPLVLTLPNCFAFGTSPSNQASITAVLPSSGSNEGNTRVTIFGSGFRAPLQVFFGNTEATVLSIAFNQIIALTPPAFGAGANNLNQSVPVRVHLVESGQDAILGDGFRYVVDNVITAISNGQQRVDVPFSTVTLFGHGFQAPVAVTLAGIPVASVISVAATEVVVLPGTPFVSGCGDVGGESRVVNINTGDVAVGPEFVYLVAQTRPFISSSSPASGPSGTNVTILGGNFLGVTTVRFGSVGASFTIGSSGSISAAAPPSDVTTPPQCPPGTAAGTPINVQSVPITVQNANTGCNAESGATFNYTLPCVVPTATPVPSVTPTATP
jgi:hypothetical protein